MARGSRDLAKFLQIENGKRFRGLSQISTKRKWQEVQRDFVTKKGGWRAKPPRRLFPYPPAERKREEALGGRSPPPRAKRKDDLSS